MPGEYVEARVISTIPRWECSKTSSEKYLQTILEEEKEYLESDKSDLLRARKMQPRKREEGPRRKSKKEPSDIFNNSISFRSFLGIITIYRTIRS